MKDLLKKIIEMDENARKIKEQAELKVSLATIHRAIKRMDIIFKKTLYPQGQNSPRVQGLISLWKTFRLGWNINNLVFIDESSINMENHH